jgi:ribonucleoside-diphosphate reductase alpha chain
MKANYPNQASEFVALRSYCRWLPEENRRETWEEVTDRVLAFLRSETYNVDKIPSKVWSSIKKGMLNFNVMPSMRLVATAGPAAKRNNICMYNCSYTPLDSLRSFSELMFILMCGTGVGYSVESRNIRKLPVIKHQTGKRRDDYTIEDNREGWAKAFLFGLETWYSGEDVVFKYEKIRPYATPLVVSGGRASGPEPLKELLEFSRDVIINASGRKLKTIECHDIACKTAEIVVVGGVRRSSCISFSDLDDRDMMEAKKDNYPLFRRMANNSAVHNYKPDTVTFLREWSSLAESGTGERGIVNVSNLDKVTNTRNFNKDMRLNPCSEIILRPMQCCNLSEAVVRRDDDISDLVDKVKTASWLGIVQSTFSHFPNLRDKWRKNAEEERLIGVSLTGQLDNPAILTDEVLNQLKKVVIKTAKHASKLLDINEPVAFTCTKPSGTVSQVVNSSSGCHPRYSKYYIRRYRISKVDPLFMLLKDQGVPYAPEVGQTKDNATTMVVEFPVKSPDTCVTKEKWDAMDQLEWYKRLQKNWSTHNVSNTVYVKDDQWLKVGNWVYENFDDIVGISFLPFDDHKYKLAPNEAIDEKTYNKLVEKFPTIDFSKLGEYEKQTGDKTEAASQPACTSDRCELKIK